MKISVVIPLFNKEETVVRTLCSVLAQTRQPIEIIIIDDGSTDASSERVRTLRDPRIKVITTINSGISVARNIGVQNATGDYVAFLDADDTWEPGFLEEVWELKRVFPNAEWFGTGFNMIKAYSWPRWIRKGPKGRSCRSYFCYPIGSFCASSAVVSREVFLKEGGFDEEERFSEDLEFWFRLGIRYDIAISGKRLSNWYLNAPNRSPERVHTIAKSKISTVFREVISTNKFTRYKRFTISMHYFNIILIIGEAIYFRSGFLNMWRFILGAVDNSVLGSLLCISLALLGTFKTLVRSILFGFRNPSF